MYEICIMKFCYYLINVYFFKQQSSKKSLQDILYSFLFQLSKQSHFITQIQNNHSSSSSNNNHQFSKIHQFEDGYLKSVFQFLFQFQLLNMVPSNSNQLSSPSSSINNLRDLIPMIGSVDSISCLMSLYQFIQKFPSNCQENELIDENIIFEDFKSILFPNQNHHFISSRALQNENPTTPSDQDDSLPNPYPNQPFMETGRRTRNDHKEENNQDLV